MRGCDNHTAHYSRHLEKMDGCPDGQMCSCACCRLAQKTPLLIKKNCQTCSTTVTTSIYKALTCEINPLQSPPQASHSPSASLGWKAPRLWYGLWATSIQMCGAHLEAVSDHLGFGTTSTWAFPNPHSLSCVTPDAPKNHLQAVDFASSISLMSSKPSLDASPAIKAAVSSRIDESALSGFRSQTPHYLLAFTAPSRIAAGVAFI